MWQPQPGLHSLFPKLNQLAYVLSMRSGLHLVTVPKRLHGGLDDVVNKISHSLAYCFVLWSKGEIDHDGPPTVWN
jgi:hypothetical protein